jgi:hypothetical protein
MITAALPGPDLQQEVGGGLLPAAHLHLIIPVDQVILTELIVLTAPIAQLELIILPDPVVLIDLIVLTGQIVQTSSIILTDPIVLIALILLVNQIVQFRPIILTDLSDQPDLSGLTNRIDLPDLSGPAGLSVLPDQADPQGPIVPVNLIVHALTDQVFLIGPGNPESNHSGIEKKNPDYSVSKSGKTVLI